MTTPNPRKPAASKKSATLTIRLKPSEIEAIRTAAAKAELTITDYIVAKCCGTP